MRRTKKVKTDVVPDNFALTADSEIFVEVLKHSDCMTIQTRIVAASKFSPDNIRAIAKLMIRMADAVEAKDAT